jgi:hypothetical protein
MICHAGHVWIGTTQFAPERYYFRRKEAVFNVSYMRLPITDHAARTGPVLVVDGRAERDMVGLPGQSMDPLKGCVQD